MELKMNAVQLPESVTFNYEELRNEIQEKAKFYNGLVFTEEQLPEAKKTRSDLNKLKKALNDERIRQEREYMNPFNEFKAQINEIIGLISEPVNAIDSQIKNFEEKQKEEKLEKIRDFWNTKDVPEWLDFKSIFESEWLNKSYSMKKVQEAITEILEQIASDMKTLEALPEFRFESVECYKDTLDINRAIFEGQRLADIQKRKLEAEARKAEQEAALQEIAEQAELNGTASAAGVIEAAEELKKQMPAAQWVSFKALMTEDQARELRKFFNDRKIDFKAI